MITLQSTSIPQLPPQYHSWPASAKKQYLAKLQQELQARKRALAQQTYASSTSTTILLPSLHQSQREIKALRRRFNVLNCGRRFGKDILCVDLAIEIIVSGGQVGWFQPTYKSLMEVWRLVKQILRGVTPPRGVNTQDKRIEITSGGVIEFWSLDNDPEACRGREYDRVIINEAAKVRQLQTAWELAIRATLIKPEGKRQGDAYFASTPRGRDYFYNLYQLGEVGTLTYDPEWYSITRTTYDNPTRARSEIEAFEKSMPVTVGRQEIRAQFLDVAGRFFDEWAPTRKIGVVRDGLIVEVEEEWHVVKPFVIPAHWHMWGSVDYGTSANRKTFCFELFAADPFGGVIMVDMVYLAGAQAIEQAEAVCACLLRWGRAKPVQGNMWEMDRTLSIIAMDWASTFPPEKAEERKGKYPVEYYWERCLPVVKAVKDRVAGWRECKQILHDVIEVKKVDANGEEDNDIYPKFRVFEGNCSDFIRTIPQMLTDEKNVEDIEQHDLGVDEGEGHMEDHPEDCWRYGMMTRPQSSAEEAPPQQPPSKAELERSWGKVGGGNSDPTREMF